MEKKEIIEIASALGFDMDYDQFDVERKSWIRFTLKDEQLDEPDLRFIWYRNFSLVDNLKMASSILFKAGQKAYRERMNTYIDLHP